MGNQYYLALSVGVSGICLEVGKEWDNYVALLVHDSLKCITIIKLHQVWYKIYLH